MNGWRVLVSGMLVLGLVFSLIPTSHAALFNRGTDSAGNRLIYDNDLDITWYDYTSSQKNWEDQISWAENLVVNFGGTEYTKWRLPVTVDGPRVLSYDGTTTFGWNNTDSEMGHLFYEELGNKGYFAPDGSYPQSGWGLSNTGDFQNLYAQYYWSGTEYGIDPTQAWAFLFTNGRQDITYKTSANYALAVHPGDVAAAVPLPASLLLLATGLSGLVVFRGRARRRRS